MFKKKSAQEEAYTKLGKINSQSRTIENIIERYEEIIKQNIIQYHFYDHISDVSMPMGIFFSKDSYDKVLENQYKLIKSFYDVVKREEDKESTLVALNICLGLLQNDTQDLLKDFYKITENKVRDSLVTCHLVYMSNYNFSLLDKMKFILKYLSNQILEEIGVGSQLYKLDENYLKEFSELFKE